MKTSILRVCALAATALGLPAQADKLDDIIASGTLRGAVVLDSPPMGLRDADNHPVGFDVDGCKDPVAALCVTPEYGKPAFPARIPAPVSDRADAGAASNSDTLGRVKTIGVTIPCFVVTNAVLTREGAGAENFEGLKGHVVGSVVGSVGGTFEGLKLEDNVKAWGTGAFRPCRTQADVFLALSQGQIDATVVTSTVACSVVPSGQYPGLRIAGGAPYPVDFVSLIAMREEYGLPNYLNPFVNQQARTGRYQELYEKWDGGTAPDLTIGGVYR